MINRTVTHRLTWALAAPGLLGGCTSPKSGPPQLGQASLKEILAALTPEEKVQLVVGMGFYPAGFPPDALPAGNPGDKDVPEKVPGAAGRTHAVARLGIPSLTLSDGPASVRIAPIRGKDSTKTYYATAFLVATLLASTWDTALVRRVGVAFGSEVRAFGIDVLLAPGMNSHRNPLGGRNFEYYSEDPVVTGNIAAALVSGVESNDVGASIKHVAVNNMDLASFDTPTSAWVAAAGTYTVRVGASPLAIKQQTTFQLSIFQVVMKSRPLLVPQQPVADLKAGQPRPGSR
ncbi:glycoside hydrolase family 3 N-terminal domain-containing protein [Hymenobacter sp. H14-R3]|uniref:glycoside hydrolase family 3 N-terminal domain-containing protein n=1 Tax=Hymenobacter sp. H14-R3 TaxID=3046308 RepID=UPI0024BA422F|nr:glycoside hydrolase family 3 N-terminal domain-containing protein [Hymenobacter sp. H14-R3]MDJ0365708.1 glycoside hydrolase family 3 N-terminal domain-containing protein [Hymenobacter sp. H14-R3]